MLPKKAEIEIPLLRALLELGGGGETKDIYPLVTKAFPHLAETDLAQRNPSGGSKWINRIQWVRQNLVRRGDMASGGRGVWAITDKGRQRIAAPPAAAPAGGSEEVTGYEAGLSGEAQIMIALRTMAANGGRATMQQIYEAVEARLGRRRLSGQGKASLRFFINRVAVRQGYVHTHDPDNPGWRITDKGLEAIPVMGDEQPSAVQGTPVPQTVTTETPQPPGQSPHAAVEPQPAETARKASSLKLHNILRDNLYQLGELLGKHPQKEFREHPYVYDVIWREFADAPRATHVFEIQDRGNLIEALAKLQHAMDIWGSTPFLVVTGEKDRHRLQQLMRPLLAGTFHRLSAVLVQLNQQDVEELCEILSRHDRLVRRLLA